MRTYFYLSVSILSVFSTFGVGRKLVKRTWQAFYLGVSVLGVFSTLGARRKLAK